jgi:hypothetical protein
MMLTELLVLNPLEDGPTVSIDLPSADADDQWIRCGTVAFADDAELLESVEVVLLPTFIEEVLDELPADLTESAIEDAIRAILYMLPTTIGRRYGPLVRGLLKISEQRWLVEYSPSADSLDLIRC